MKLTKKLIVLLIRLALPFAIFAIVWNGLLALFFRALGSREDARDFMNASSRMFKTVWTGIKREFSAKEILKDYYDVDRYLNEEEP